MGVCRRFEEIIDVAEDVACSDVTGVIGREFRALEVCHAGSEALRDHPEVVAL